MVCILRRHMAIFPIRTFGDPVLRTVAEPVEEITSALERLVDDMLETMYDAPGVGLAAPQIGVSKRIFVADIGEGAFVMVNPELVETSGEWAYDEGCLSVPGRFWPIDRPGFASARGLDLGRQRGHSRRRRADGSRAAARDRPSQRDAAARETPASRAQAGPAGAS